VKRIYGILLLSVVFTTVTCSGGNRAVDDASVAKAAAALAPFKSEMKAALMDGLSSGPEQAITVCSEKAPALAAELSRDGVELGRTSHKLRNPENAPPDWVKPLLADYAGGDDALYRAVDLGDGRIGYVEPIYVQAPCLMCHGETIAPVLAGRIAQHYPDDRATGFDDGDFRGLFWVTVEVDEEK
jgi:hypothetical protein